METAIEFYEERRTEIEFYYTTLIEIAKPNSPIRTGDNHRFVRILKSNFLLMLYNLVESCVRKGFESIYEAVKDSGEPYAKISVEIGGVWSDYEISKAHNSNANKQTYGQRVREIIGQVISNQPLIITRDALDISGNLDARKIRDLLKNHDIGFSESGRGDKTWIFEVKKKRNALAHGDESFDEAARDLSIADLEKIKCEVLDFIKDVLDGMKNYYDQKLYIRQNQ